MEEIQPGIYRRKDDIYTEAASEKSVYGETFIEVDRKKYRKWDASRSKVGAAVQKGIDLEVERDEEVLYLGAASGTTVSHFSDILDKGFIFGVEYSETVIRDLLDVAESRENIAPILGNARNPEEYSNLVDEADVIFQDISQSDQPEIFIKNCDRYLKDDGVGLLAVKAQSISTAEEPEDVFEDVKEKLTDHFDIVSETTLEPYETAHLFLKLKKK